MSGVCGVLLAAGSGSRFGGGKLIHPLPASGIPLAVAAWRHLRAAVPQSCVVVRAGETAVAQLFRAEGARVVECEDAGAGMGRSLSCGVRANPYARGWIIALGDMPCVEVATIRWIADTVAERNRIVVPTRQGKRGHPVGFPVRLYAELADLQGDIGARTVLQANAADLVERDVDDPGIFADVDTPADLGRLARGP